MGVHCLSLCLDSMTAFSESSLAAMASLHPVNLGHDTVAHFTERVPRLAQLLLPEHPRRELIVSVSKRLILHPEHENEMMLP